jgi:hypothetical protein
LLKGDSLDDHIVGNDGEINGLFGNHTGESKTADDAFFG